MWTIFVWLAILGAGCSGMPVRVAPAGLKAPKEICGLPLPCLRTVVRSHDYHGMFKASAERYRRLMVGFPSSRKGCFVCPAPQVFFRSLLADPSTNGKGLMHILFALSAVRLPRKTGSGDSGFSVIHRVARRSIRRAQKSGQPVSCSIVTAFCVTRPAFAAAFRWFLPEILMRRPPDSDPGYAKEFAVRLAFGLDLPGTLPTIERFIRSRARVRARMKAVRGLCWRASKPAVRRILRWVVRYDPDLRHRAAKCLPGSLN